MNTPRSALFLLFALATIILLVGCRRPATVGAAQPDASVAEVVHRAQGSPPVQKPRIEVISARALARDFASDSAASTRRSARQVVEVTGELGNLEAGGDGVPVLTLRGGAGFKDPRFVLDADAWPDVSTLKTGATVRLSCRDGSESAGQVTLKACALL